MKFPQRLMKTGNLYQNIFITYRVYRIIFTGLVTDKATNDPILSQSVISLIVDKSKVEKNYDLCV